MAGDTGAIPDQTVDEVAAAERMSRPLRAVLAKEVSPRRLGKGKLNLSPLKVKLLDLRSSSSGSSTELSRTFPPPPSETHFSPSTSKWAILLDDGCALGHLPKDVGFLVYAARQFATYRSKVEEKGPGGEKRGQLLVLFSDPCVHDLRDNAHAAQPQRAGNEGNDLFSVAIRPQFEAAKQLIESHWGIQVSWVLSFRVLEVWDSLKADQANSDARPVPVLLRPQSWRWFATEQDASTVRDVLLHRVCGLSRKTTAAPAGGMESKSKVSFAPLQLVIVSRRHNRRFVDEALRSALQRHYGQLLNVTKVSLELLPFCRQMDLLSNADVLVAAHGAALTNIIALRPRPESIVVELFPHHFRYSLYEELARSIGATYFAWEAERVDSGCASKCPHRPAPGIDSPLLSSSGVNVEEEETPLADAEKPLVDNSPFSEYVALRQLNGLSRCKNCDIPITPLPVPVPGNNRAATDAISTSLLNTLRNAIISTLLTRTRNGNSGAVGLTAQQKAELGKDGQLGTIRYIDRRG